jgi:hypothetical protein
MHKGYLEEHGQLTTVVNEILIKQGDNPILSTLFSMTIKKAIRVAVTYILGYAGIRLSTAAIDGLATRIEREIASSGERATLGKSTAALE